jgi:hypothetical protein
MPKLRPVRTPEELASVPSDQPVVIELSEPEPATVPGQEPEIKAPEAIVAREPEKEPEAESALKKQLEDLKKAEEASQREIAALRERETNALLHARQRTEELQYERGEREQAQYDSVLNALGAAQAEADKAQNDLANAMAASDFTAAAEAQRRLSVATTRIVQLEDGKVAFDNRREEAQRQPQPQPQQQQQRYTDPIDAMTHLSGKQRDWLKSHREVQSDPRKLAAIGDAHWKAMDAGHSQDSDGYFQFLEERLGYRQPVAKQEEEPEPQPQRRSMPVSAPVSRDTPSMSTGRSTPTRIELSPEQREAAKISGLTDFEYAKNLIRLNDLKKAGHYNERG